MKYEIWIDNQEQWDANDIDPPVETIEANEPATAAIKFMEQGGEDDVLPDDEARLILRDEDGNYTAVYVHKEGWECGGVRKTSLKELCSP